MATTITITGTGCPILSADRAGPGVLVSHGDTRLQFDAGRATVMRLAAVGTRPADLDAVFLTHHHSDHLTGLEDLVLTRWTLDRSGSLPRLPIVSPFGPTSFFVERMLDHWDSDIAVRQGHTGRTDRPSISPQPFTVPDTVTEVWRSGEVTVLAGPVRHEPVPNAVGYRVETPDGIVAISGDTLVCPEVAHLARGADVVVYEAMRFSTIPPDAENAFIRDYHADTVAIGTQLAELGTPTAVLTHLIPPPRDDAAKQDFEDDLRRGGFEGQVVVADDLTTITLG